MSDALRGLTLRGLTLRGLTLRGLTLRGLTLFVSPEMAQEVGIIDRFRMC